MKHFFKEPMFWCLVAACAFVGCFGLLMGTSEYQIVRLFAEHWLMGFGGVGVFMLMGVANYFGTKFPAVSEKNIKIAEEVPLNFVCFAFGELVIVMIIVFALGVNSPYILHMIVAALIVAFLAAFAGSFLRGMAPEDSDIRYRTRRLG